MIQVSWLSLAGLVLILGCPGNGGTIPQDDDDASDDDAGDDDSWDPCPWYYAECSVTVPHDPQGPPGEGSFDMTARLDFQAELMWVEMWDKVSGYCEGWDPYTGDVCETAGYGRPGWDLQLVATEGTPGEPDFCAEWSLHLEYIVDLDQAHAAGKSVFVCENAGNNFQLYFCGCNYATDECFCTAYPMNAWGEGSTGSGHVPL